MKVQHFVLVLVCFVLLFFQSVQAQYIKHSIRFQKQAKGEISLIGNTLLKSRTLSNGSMNPKANMYGQILDWIDNDANIQTFSSSAAKLEVMENSKVLWAGLYWHSYNQTKSKSKNALIQFPWMKDYQQVTSTTFGSNGYFYFAFSDVTSLLQDKQLQSGLVWVANLDGNNSLPDVTHCAWSLVVVYENNTLECKDLLVIDGYQWLQSGSIQIPLPVSASDNSRNESATLGIVAFEGDGGVSGDYILLSGNPLNDSTDLSTNVLNGTITKYGRRVNTNVPSYINQLGVDIDQFYVGEILSKNSKPTIEFGVTSNPDWNFPCVITLESEVQANSKELSEFLLHTQGQNSTVSTSLTITNSSSREIRFTTADFLKNAGFSIPISAFPIVIPPAASTSITVWFNSSKFGIVTDTLLFSGDCSWKYTIPLRANNYVNAPAISSFCDQIILGKATASTIRILSVSPQPIRESAEIIFETPNVPSEILQVEKSLLLYDMLGNEFHCTIQQNSSSENENIRLYSVVFDVSDIPNGQYILKLSSGSTALGTRIIVFR